MHGIKHIEFKELTLEDLFEAEDQSEIEVEIERERRVENSFGILTKV